MRHRVMTDVRGMRTEVAFIKVVRYYTRALKGKWRDVQLTKYPTILHRQSRCRNIDTVRYISYRYSYIPSVSLSSKTHVDVEGWYNKFVVAVYAVVFCFRTFYCLSEGCNCMQNSVIVIICCPFK